MFFHGWLPAPQAFHFELRVPIQINLQPDPTSIAASKEDEILIAHPRFKNPPSKRKKLGSDAVSGIVKADTLERKRLRSDCDARCLGTDLEAPKEEEGNQGGPCENHSKRFHFSISERPPGNLDTPKRHRPDCVPASAEKDLEPACSLDLKCRDSKPKYVRAGKETLLELVNNTSFIVSLLFPWTVWDPPTSQGNPRNPRAQEPKGPIGPGPQGIPKSNLWCPHTPFPMFGFKSPEGD
jgi:hypothetical protein